MFRKRAKRSEYDDTEVEALGDWVPEEKPSWKYMLKKKDEDSDETFERPFEEEAHIPRRERRRIRYTTEREVGLALLEFLIFVIFLVLATIVCLSVRHTYMYYFNKTVEKFFVTRLIQAQNEKLVFTDLLTINQFWDYLIYCFLPTLHSGEKSMNERRRRGVSPSKSAGGFFRAYDPDDPSPEGYFLYENQLLGPPRIRQLRVKIDTCTTSESFSSYRNHCYAEYKDRFEDTAKEYKTTFYKSMWDLDAYTINGVIASYSKGGYVKDLTYNGPENIKILSELRDLEWIDRGTRLVVVEFNLFNRNTDLFESVKLLCEFLPTGSIITSAKMRVIKKYSFWTDPSLQLKAMYIAFYVMVVYYTVMVVNDFRILLLWYFTEILDIFELIILTFAYLALFYNSFHSIEMYLVEKHADEKANEFYSLDRLIYWNMMYIDMMGIMVFLVWIKIFRFIGFNKTLIQFTWTLKKCAKDLFGFSLMFIVVFLAFALLGMVLFGEKHREFVDFTKAVLMMIRMILTDFEYPLLEQANRTLGPVFFVAYILLVYFILLNMFLAIIMETYNAVKSYSTRDSSILGSYLWKRIRAAYMFMCRCGRPPERKLEKAHEDVITGHEGAMELRQSQVAVDLENRISLLEQVVDQVNSKMDSISRKFDRELEWQKELERHRQRVRELEEEDRLRFN